MVINAGAMLLHGLRSIGDLPRVVQRFPSPKRLCTPDRSCRRTGAWCIAAGTLGVLMLGGLQPMAAQAGPVLCTTTLEAPIVSPGQPLQSRSGPTEVTRCGVVGTVPELVEQRYFSYRSPFARGVDITHQITDVLGLAMGGGDGTRLMGLGFPDQAIIWDGSAIETTTIVLMDQQVNLVPRRTADLPSPYSTSVRSCGEAGPSPVPCRPASMLGEGDPTSLTYPP